MAGIDDISNVTVRAHYSTDTGQRGRSERERLAAELEGWWRDLALEEVQRVVPKAVEYGSTDLIDIGRELARLIKWANPTDEECAEIGIYFYIVGKMSRWSDAIQRRERVSDDTLHDIGVYVRMAQRVRAVGGWPIRIHHESCQFDTDHPGQCGWAGVPTRD